MSSMKTYGAIAVMIACFAVVYPRFMHPLVLRIFGWQESANNNMDDISPPGYRNAHQGQRQDKDDVRKHMRPGPHPGMRAAAEMHRQQAQQGSGRGMMGIVLPMYAVGIVLYLGYTLFKVFNRGDQKSSQWSTKKNYYGGRGQGSSPEHDRMGFPNEFDGNNGDVKNFLRDQDQRRDLEELLTRVDDKNVSVEEMRLLQKRLEETEAQMTRILRAMSTVQENVETIPETEPDMTSSKLEPNEMKETSSNKEEKGNNDVDHKESESSRMDSEETATPDNKKNSSDADMSKSDTSKDADGKTEDEKRNSEKDGIEDKEINDAFDVEEAAEEEDETTDEIISDKSNSEEVEEVTARKRNTRIDQE